MAKALAFVADEGFKRFWANYPRKQKRRDALKAWGQIAPAVELIDQMVIALEWQRRQPQWTDFDGRYVPLAGTWLRGEQWEDEPCHATPIGRTGATCPHTPPCERLSACITLTLQQAKAAREA